MDVDDFRWGLLDYGVQVYKEEAIEIMKYFDQDNKDSVNYLDFLKFVESQTPQQA
jgi:Ca2+-binding EF-hand superfamily protein